MPVSANPTRRAATSCPSRKMARRAARESANYTLEKLARRVGKSPRYLAQIESRGGAPEHLAQALSANLQCKKELFL